MKITRIITLLPFLIIGACSDDNEIPAPKTATPATGSEAAAPAKTNPSSPFSAQLEALGTAKLVSQSAQESIDKSQQSLEDAKD